MKTIYNTTLAILFTIILFTVAVQAKTIRVADAGAIADDNIDDTEAVRTAVRDLIDSGGGTLIFPEGTIDISGDIRFQTQGNYQSYLLRGDRGAFIRLGGYDRTDYFVFGNNNQVDIDGLIFYAPQLVHMNANTVIQSSYTSITKITNCSFFGIGARTSIVEAHNTDLIVDKTQFEGSSANRGVVHSLNSRGVTVSNSTFIDYANFLNMYLSKTPHVSTEAWINIETDNLKTGANGQRVARIRDSRFDEGAYKAIKVKNQNAVTIDGISVGVLYTAGGAGVSLESVGFAEIKNSSFGFSTQSRPAIEISKKTYLEVTSIELTESVYFLNKDKDSQLKINYCPDCLIIR
jgi:hypothetical protein